MKDNFSVIVKGEAGPLLTEMIFVYNITRKVIFVRQDGEDLHVIWGGVEFPGLPLQDESDLVRLLQHLAGIYRLDVEEDADASEPGLRVFGLEVRG